MKRLKTVLQNIRDNLILFYICSKLRIIHACHKQAIVFISTPTHGNLGDQAIVFSQYRFFETMGLGKRIVEIHRYCYERWKEKFSKMIAYTDVIVIDGGGNMGSLWPEEEHKMQDIAKRFSHNPVFVFPQTASYANDEVGQQELVCSRKAYEKNKNFFVFARDKATLNTMRDHMPEVRCMYTPDMVMFIDEAHTCQQREGILLCLRKDTERVLTIDQFETLKRRLNESGLNVTESSTVITDAVWKFQRKKVLQKKWNEFSSVQLVVTDRLHGMVFSAITGTPCIALDNISHKVYGAYQWLSYLPYLRFCSSIDEVENAAKELLKLPPQNYDLKPLLPYYNEMRNVVKNAIENVEQVTNGD